MLLPTNCIKEGAFQNSLWLETLKNRFYVKKGAVNFESIKYIPLPTFKIAFY